MLVEQNNERSVPEALTYEHSAKEYEALVEQAKRLNDLTKPMLSDSSSNWLVGIRRIPILHILIPFEPHVGPNGIRLA